MTDELWEQVRRLRDSVLRRSERFHARNNNDMASACIDVADAYETVCRLAGRPLPEWRPEQKDKP